MCFGTTAGQKLTEGYVGLHSITGIAFQIFYLVLGACLSYPLVCLIRTDPLTTNWHACGPLTCSPDLPAYSKQYKYLKT